MTPMLGIMASSITKSKIATGSFYSIATVTGTGSSSTITFSSIPSTYKHLQIRAIARQVSGGYSSQSPTIRFNGDTTAGNYNGHQLFGYNSGGSNFVAATANGANLPRFVQGSAVASSSMYGAVIVDIIDYASTSKYKTMRAFGGNDTNGDASGTNQIELGSALWMSTSAISSITITEKNAQSFTTASTFALYGIN